MKNTMVKNKTLLASAILALTAVSSVAYAAPVEERQSIILTADIKPTTFYVKHKSGDPSIEHELKYDPLAETLAPVTVAFTHKNIDAKAIQAQIDGEARVTHETNAASFIPLTVSYNGVAINNATPIQVVADTASDLVSGGEANVVITPDNFANVKSTIDKGKYNGTVTINFSSQVN
ncbi:CS1 type fimbrial major subunit [Candidatus Regiella insecticola]|uniref:CS1 type fimbrial major subunit protein n=1 Tax=Candidatus Regiella insecticola TaxID=138073 RepID=A0A6L2ZLG6_9ENTR|nr:CS1 type fimbrial major subunit [Candidatus Regiella insecticola]GFN45274.1 CS1 type fimbrial major subunit protein [Candidatus Regiella insecticola]